MSTNDPMTQERLDAIQARLDARTPGEWEASGREIEALAPSWCEVVSATVDCTGYCYAGIDRAEDADLIAHAPEDLAYLLAEVEALRPRAALADAMIERVARDTAAKESFTSRRQWEDLPHDERTHLRAHAHRVLTADLTPQEDA